MDVAEAILKSLAWRRERQSTEVAEAILKSKSNSVGVHVFAQSKAAGQAISNGTDCSTRRGNHGDVSNVTRVTRS